MKFTLSLIKPFLQWEMSLFLWKVQGFPQQYISCVFQETANKFQKKEKQFNHNFCYSFLPPLTQNNKIIWTCQSLLWLIAFLVCVPHFILWLRFLTQEIVSKRQYIKEPINTVVMVSGEPWRDQPYISTSPSSPKPHIGRHWSCNSYTGGFGQSGLYGHPGFSLTSQDSWGWHTDDAPSHDPHWL